MSRALRSVLTRQKPGVVLAVVNHPDAALVFADEDLEVVQALFLSDGLVQQRFELNELRRAKLVLDASGHKGAAIKAVFPRRLLGFSLPRGHGLDRGRWESPPSTLSDLSPTSNSSPRQSERVPLASWGR